MTRKLLTLSCFAATVPILAQSDDAKLRFESASIERVDSTARPMYVSTRGGPGTPDPTHFTCQSCSFETLVLRAFALPKYRLSAPSWAETTRFNLQAQVPEGVTNEQFQAMLQDLLVERFHLKLHRENKEVPAYELTQASGGHTMTSAKPRPEGEPVPDPSTLRKLAGGNAPGEPVTRPYGRASMLSVTTGGILLESPGETMGWLCMRLQPFVNRPVEDATGLEGRFKFSLSFESQHDERQLRTALQRQLGLRLEPKRINSEMLVVDHAEKSPSR